MASSDTHHKGQIMTHSKRLLTLLTVASSLAALPAGAFAMDNDPNGDPAGPGGCHYTDADGYDIPIHNGETVFVDGKLVTCKTGTVVITTAPLRTQPVKVKWSTPIIQTATLSKTVLR
jgi:hypothetical protein